MPSQPAALPSAEEMNAFLDAHYPQLNPSRRSFHVVEVRPGGCTVRLEAASEHLRAGGTLAGSAIFTLADVGGYVCALSHAGPDALAVTTNLSINFLRRAGPGSIDAHCRILKLGRRLVVFEAEIMAAEALIAHATGTFSIPPGSRKLGETDMVK